MAVGAKVKRLRLSQGRQRLRKVRARIKEPSFLLAQEG